MLLKEWPLVLPSVFNYTSCRSAGSPSGWEACLPIFRGTFLWADKNIVSCKGKGRLFKITPAAFLILSLCDNFSVCLIFYFLSSSSKHSSLMCFMILLLPPRRSIINFKSTAWCFKDFLNAPPPNALQVLLSFLPPPIHVVSISFSVSQQWKKRKIKISKKKKIITQTTTTKKPHQKHGVVLSWQILLDSCSILEGDW